jgi:hypothetical protein
LVPVARRVGPWALAVPADLERECGATLAAIERVLEQTAAPQGGWWGGQEAGFAPSFLPSNHALLAVSFALLVLGTVHILYREVKAQRPWPYAVGALVLAWGGALALRLSISPQTFLHEYYHIAETVPGYLTGEIPAAYGKTAPTMFRLLGAALGRPEDVEIIFLTTAIVSSLAIPAVALLDLAVMRSWPRALCAAVLLAVLPQHLRYSAAEDLFVHAVSFGLWSLALFALYLRTRRLEDALVGALALSLAMQARPEMLFFPAVLVAMVLLVEPRSWRLLVAWRTLVAVAVLGVLLVPRLFEFQQALRDGPGPVATLPTVDRYLHNLVLLQSEVTPPVYWALSAVGLLWGLRHRPGYHLWAILVFVGYTLFSLSIFSNPPYNLRSQILPTSFLILVAAGAAPVWMSVWGHRQRLGLALGAAALATLAAGVLVTSRGFVTELRDQQLEWMFLERTVPLLPDEATLLSAVDTGGHNLDAFPEFLLRGAQKTYRMVDVRRAAKGDVAWPAPSEDLLFYQGMFCYFAFDDEPSPEPMTLPCRAVHERYVAQPLLVQELHTQGYSALRYAGGPYRIGFFRLIAAR